MTTTILACSASAESILAQLVQAGIPCHQAEILAEAITTYRSNQTAPHPSVHMLLEQYRTGIQRAVVLPRGLMTT